MDMIGYIVLYKQHRSQGIEIISTKKTKIEIEFLNQNRNPPYHIG